MPTQLEVFRGQESLAAPVHRIFDTLTDPRALARAIPGLVSHELVDPQTLHGVLRPGFSFLRATMRMVLTITEAIPASDGAPARVRVSIASQGIGASMKVECQIILRESPDGGTLADWEANVNELSGLITAVSPTLIRGAADKVIRDGWDAVRREVDAA